MGHVTRRGVLAGAAALAVAPAEAQSGTMTLVVPFPPGGSTDVLARMLQAPLQSRLNRVVIVENKTGASGSIGAAQVARSAPDGSSLLITFDFDRGDPYDSREADTRCRAVTSWACCWWERHLT